MSRHTNKFPQSAHEKAAKYHEQRTIDAAERVYAAIKDKQPAACGDIFVAACLCRTQAGRYLRLLCKAGRIKVVGMARDAGRTDIHANIVLYGTVDAPMLRKAVRVPSATGNGYHAPYVGKPLPVSPPRVRAERWRGEKGGIYQREFKPLELSAERDWRAHRDTCMRAR